MAKSLKKSKKWSNKGGRPTVITNKVLSELKTAFCMDSTDKEACVFAGISEKTLYNYQKKHPEFLQEKELWKSAMILEARKAVKERIESGDAWFALRFLCKKLPDEFHSPQRGFSKPPENLDELSEVIKRIENR